MPPSLDVHSTTTPVISYLSLQVLWLDTILIPSLFYPLHHNTILITNNASLSTWHVSNEENYVEETVSTRYLGLKIDSNLKCKNHIEQINPKLV
jgi:hypothetical protein